MSGVPLAGTEALLTSALHPRILQRLCPAERLGQRVECISTVPGGTQWRTTAWSCKASMVSLHSYAQRWVLGRAGSSMAWLEMRSARKCHAVGR